MFTNTVYQTRKSYFGDVVKSSYKKSRKFISYKTCMPKCLKSFINSLQF